MRDEFNSGEIGLIGDYGFRLYKLQKSPERSRRYVGKDTAIKETQSGRGEVIFIVLLSASLILVVGWIMG
jgi:hypothetical protein